MNWQQFLTEKVLKECWHEWECAEFKTFKCSICGKWIPEKDAYENSNRRRFTTRNDLMDLYQKIYEDGKWEDFFWDFAFQRKPENYGLGEAETSVWLFCLDGKGHEERCKIVAEFYGWKGEK